VSGSEDDSNLENGFTSRHVPPDFSDSRVRARLSGAAAYAIVKIAELWKITDAEACALLGGFPADQWARMKAESWSGTFSEDEIKRLSALIGIFKGLHTLVSDPLADEWLSRPNTDEIYRGQRPLDYMICGGFDAIMTVRRHVEAVCQGY
jgi:hypothetical protein